MGMDSSPGNSVMARAILFIIIMSSVPGFLHRGIDSIIYFCIIVMSFTQLVKCLVRLSTLTIFRACE